MNYEHYGTRELIDRINELENQNNKPKKLIQCPLCTDGELIHEQQDSTHFYVCSVCPVVVTEWYDKKDTVNFTKRF